MNLGLIGVIGGMAGMVAMASAQNWQAVCWAGAATAWAGVVMFRDMRS